MESTKLGRYSILSELGRGAMGVVYKATDTVLERTVAVKTVNMALEKDGAEKYEARFYQEARAAGSLNHPAIVTVYDVGKEGDIAYMAMEFIEGVELRSLIGEGRALPVSQALSIASQVAEGLAYAHQHSVVHRDIKPANIMVLTDGAVKITDFGIARMRTAADELTQTGMMLGSPKYMSPEQVIGKRADQRSDIFSLGVILYEMLTGTAPFGGENVTALMYQIVNFAPPAPSAVNPAVPVLLDYVVAKMLAKPLEERYADAQALARDLRDCERQMSAPQAIPQPRPLGLASGTQPELAVTQAQAVVMAQTLNRTRHQDAVPEQSAAPPARGLAHSFDSAEATQRLASLTGADANPNSVSATQALSSLRPPQKRGWRRRDWLLVGGATALGALVARAILRR
jgi:serine/threonine-protein kinase